MIIKSREKILKKLLGKNLADFDEKELIQLLMEHEIVDIDDEMNKKATFGDRAADKLASCAGSWGFVLGFMFFLIFWILLNAVFLLNAPDPYPFILLNLVLSCIAAIQAPIIMMSQNRQTAKDTKRSKNDYKTNIKSELILELLYQKTQKLEENQTRILQQLNRGHR